MQTAALFHWSEITALSPGVGNLGDLKSPLLCLCLCFHPQRYRWVSHRYACLWGGRKRGSLKKGPQMPRKYIPFPSPGWGLFSVAPSNPNQCPTGNATCTQITHWAQDTKLNVMYPACCYPVGVSGADNVHLFCSLFTNEKKKQRLLEIIRGLLSSFPQ